MAFQLIGKCNQPKQGRMGSLQRKTVYFQGCSEAHNSLFLLKHFWAHQSYRVKNMPRLNFLFQIPTSKWSTLFLVFYYLLSCINYMDFLSVTTILRPYYLSISMYIFLEQMVLNGKWIFIAFLLFQFLVTSVLDNYSYLCQPVDYSRSELGMRVQFHTKLALCPPPPMGMQIVLLINSNLHA